MSDVYSGTVGLLIQLTFVDQDGAPVDLNAGTVEIVLKRPSGLANITYPDASVTVSGVGNNVGSITTLPTQTPSDGIYKAQGFLTIDANHIYPSSIHSFTVKRSLR